MSLPHCHFFKRCVILRKSLTSVELWGLQKQGLNHLQRVRAGYKTSPEASLQRGPPPPKADRFQTDQVFPHGANPAMTSTRQLGEDKAAPGGTQTSKSQLLASPCIFFPLGFTLLQEADVFFQPVSLQHLCSASGAHLLRKATWAKLHTALRGWEGLVGWKHPWVQSQ